MKIIYRLLQKVAKFAGFNLFVLLRKGSRDMIYDEMPTDVKYAPWLSDRPFNEAYAVTKKYTTKDIYRSYQLWQMVEQVSKLEGALIEVGTKSGGSGALIAKRASLVGIKDTVYLCDTFAGVVKSGENDSTYKDGEHGDTSKELVERVIAELRLDNIKILEGIFPDETGKMMHDEKIRFCYVDVDVYQSSKDALEWLWPKLVLGGVVIFDDYGSLSCDGVTRFINEERNKKDRVVIGQLNRHAIMIKIR